jgi:aminoglycoside phosphotransferase (APT) family kinase protein
VLILARDEDRVDDELSARVVTALSAWRPGAALRSLTPLPGGASGVTLLAEVESPNIPAERIVVKAAPRGFAPVRNRDVLRQARLLRALEGRPGVRVPVVLFDDAGAPPDVPPFFAMTYVPGDSVDPNIDPGVDDVLPAPEVVAGRAASAAQVLAALHAVSPVQAGLADEPEVSLADEVERWATALATVPETITGGPDHCAERLRSSLPAPVPSALIHGDFRLGNCLSAGDEVRAVIDWEIWSRSDPRIDLAWYLLTADPQRHPSAQRQAPGMPSPGELAEVYRASGGPPVPDLAWFTGLVLYKLASASALIAKNAAKRGITDGFGASAAAAVPDMLRRASQAIG